MSRFKEKKSKTGKVIVLIIIMLILIAGIIGASYVIKKNYIVKNRDFCLCFLLILAIAKLIKNDTMRINS